MTTTCVGLLVCGTLAAHGQYAWHQRAIATRGTNVEIASNNNLGRRIVMKACLAETARAYRDEAGSTSDTAGCAAALIIAINVVPRPTPNDQQLL
jgi:hypothetical protein